MGRKLIKIRFIITTIDLVVHSYYRYFIVCSYHRYFVVHSYYPYPYFVAHSYYHYFAVYSSYRYLVVHSYYLRSSNTLLHSTPLLYKLRSVQNTGTCYPGQGWFVRNLGVRSPGVPDKSSRGLGSMSRYSAQILICFVAFIFLFYSSVGLVGNFAGLPE